VRLRITGHDDADGEPTLVNGQDAPVIVEGVKAGANIYLRQGDNKLQIGNVSTQPPPGTKPVNLSGRVQIGTWNGKDVINASINNGARVTINAGPSDDAVTLARCNLNNLALNTDVVTGASQGNELTGGNDYLRVRRIATSGVALIQTGDGADDVQLKEKSKFSAGLMLDLALGSNTIYVPFISLGGESLISIDQSESAVLFGASCSGKLTFDLGSGPDGFAGGVIGGGDVTIRLGSGDDVASLGGFDVNSLTLDGGDGIDTFRDRGSNNFGTLTITGIENTESA
jgi:hypothetical protein